MNCNKTMGYLLNKAARLTRWDLNNSMSEQGITSPQWGLLKDIYWTEINCGSEDERLNKLTPAAIAERLKADRPTVSCMLDKLEKMDLACRLTNPKDRRSQIILLTERAKQLMPKLEELEGRTLEKALKGFSSEEEIQLREYLKRIIGNLIP